jgi:hypothetical protein
VTNTTASPSKSLTLRGLLAVVALIWLGAAGYAVSPIGRDDTDPGQWGARSGLMPYTDAATGCQYLRAGFGGITPRLTAKGEHMGCKTGGPQ